MKLHIMDASFRCSGVAMALEECGVEHELVWHYPSIDRAAFKAAIKDLTLTGQIPLLETPEGPLTETYTIMRYAAASSGKLNGSNAYEAAQVDQWLTWANCQLDAPAYMSMYQILGFTMPYVSYEKSSMFKNRANFQKAVEIINTHLEGKEWMVGGAVTVADIGIFNTIYYHVAFSLSDKERKRLGNLIAWFGRIAELPSFKKWWGVLRYHPTGLKFAKMENSQAAKPKKQKKKAQAKPAPKKAKKPKYVFPESDFDLMSFKTEFINEKNLEAAIANFWAKFDAKGWSLWHLKYLKYPGECEEVYRTNNLLRGFLARCQPLGKNIFGIHLIVGDEPNLEIQAVWLVRGLELFPGIKEHDQYDTYEWKQLDHTKAEDKALVEDFMTTRVADTDKVQGLTLRTFNWVK